MKWIVQAFGLKLWSIRVDRRIDRESRVGNRSTKKPQAMAACLAVIRYAHAATQVNR
jgi:hypothetical protein